MKVLATGMTGFLGQYVLRELENAGISCRSISRSEKDPYRGDLKCWNLGLDLSKLEGEEFDAFLHMGAIYDLRGRGRDLRHTNLSGTQSALTVARKLKIPRFINISSVAAVVNSPNEWVSENDLFPFHAFPDVYSKTKALAERLVKIWSKYFESTLNIRMGVLVGSTSNGEIRRIDGPYHLPEAFRKFKKLIYFSPVPIPLPGADVPGAPLVPVDVAARGIVGLLKHSLSIRGQENFHLVPKKMVPIEVLYKDSLSFLGLGHKPFQLFGALPKNAEARLTEVFTQIPREELTHLMQMPNFEMTSTERLLGENWCPEYDSYKQSFWRGYEKFIQNR